MPLLGLKKIELRFFRDQLADALAQPLHVPERFGRLRRRHGNDAADERLLGDLVAVGRLGLVERLERLGADDLADDEIEHLLDPCHLSTCPASAAIRAPGSSRSVCVSTMTVGGTARSLRLIEIADFFADAHVLGHGPRLAGGDGVEDHVGLVLEDVFLDLFDRVAARRSVRPRRLEDAARVDDLPGGVDFRELDAMDFRLRGGRLRRGRPRPRRGWPGR